MGGPPAALSTFVFSHTLLVYLAVTQDCFLFSFCFRGHWPEKGLETLDCPEGIPSGPGHRLMAEPPGPLRPTLSCSHTLLQEQGATARRFCPR